METLAYRGNVLDPNPRNMAFREVVDALVLCKPACVILEPGDMTRYVLLITPLWGYSACDGAKGAGYNTHGAVLISDLLSRNKVKPSQVVYLNTPDIVDEELRGIAPKEAWTRTMLAWWLNTLARELKSVDIPW